GNPKGVINTHFSLIDNIKDAHRAIEITQQDRFLSWMPLTHDLGMILFHLAPLLNRCSQFLLPTSLFIRRPSLWMLKTSCHKITLLCSPNFGYFHFLANVSENNLSHCRLDSVRIILNGAEPISYKLCMEFSNRLAKYGLKKNTINPSYGLAEATLVVCISPLYKDIIEYHLHRDYLGVGSAIQFVGAGSENACSFVDVGVSVGPQIKIVDQNGNQLPDQAIGHIQLKGNSITKGYYNNPAETARIISTDGWLDTGDLGFTVKDHLVITGRAKDLIIVGGTNYYPHDIERTLEDIKGLEVNKVAAASIFDDNLHREIVLVFIRFNAPGNDLSRFISLKNEARERLLNKIGLKVDHFIPVSQLPKTTSGKLQRFKLAQDYSNGKYPPVIEEIKKQEQPVPPVECIECTPPICDDEEKHKEIQAFLVNSASQLLEGRAIGLDQGLIDMGFNSLKTIRFQEIINSHFNLKLPISSIFEYPTISKISRLVLKALKGDTSREQDKLANQSVTLPSFKEPIAVIGIGCRFPGGAGTPGKFWELLKNGVDAFSEIPRERMNIEDWYSDDIQAPGKMYTKHGAFIGDNDINTFDNEFFSITPREAENMDPQQRILLEVCCQSLENAGIGLEKLVDSNTGVFIGIANDDYSRLSASNYDYKKINRYSFTGSAFSTAVGRISYFFGLQGPNYAVNTACSSSLVAVHNAVNSLRNGESDIALTGGISLNLSPDAFIISCQLTVLSKSNRARPFDDNADGYIRGEGCGIIVLKRYRDAVKDKDNILAVIKGSAVNHDGQGSGLTVPNGLAQENVIKRALANAAIAPDQVDYIEAHGSGTYIGDPLEVQALNAVFSPGRKNKLLIGTVKSNIGHLEAAAGIAGLIKTILALNQKKIPASLNFKIPNRHIPWETIPIAVTTELTNWQVDNKNRFAGVSSFGLSGTNAHVIVAEAPGFIDAGIDAQQGDVNSPYIVIFSAKTDNALQKLAASYCEYFAESDRESLRDASFTSVLSRGNWHKRLSVTGSSEQEIQNSLADYLNKKDHKNICHTPPHLPGSKRIAFLFPGAGIDLRHAALSTSKLFVTVPVFKTEIERCDRVMNTMGHPSIIEMLKNQNIDNGLKQTFGIQPLLFSVQYALAKMWIWFGITPSIVMGAGIGEYTAACTAGLLDVETALELICQCATPNFTPASHSTIPFISAGYGKEISRALDIIKQNDVQIFLEIGLNSFSPVSPDSGLLSLFSLSNDGNHWQQILNSIGKFYVNEIGLNWENVAQVIDGKKIVLPNYPFERKLFAPVEKIKPGNYPGINSQSDLTQLLIKQIEQEMDRINHQFKIMEEQLDLL
ncbi:MAG: AMP-binding protein, partial [Acidobacteria bacterium]|nr:AMP-binding protein [Acidobacteriota bacterium]